MMGGEEAQGMQDIHRHLPFQKELSSSFNHNVYTAPAKPLKLWSWEALIFAEHPGEILSHSSWPKLQIATLTIKSSMIKIYTSGSVLWLSILCPKWEICRTQYETFLSREKTLPSRVLQYHSWPSRVELPPRITSKMHVNKSASVLWNRPFCLRLGPAHMFTNSYARTVCSVWSNGYIIVVLTSFFFFLYLSC